MEPSSLQSLNTPLVCFIIALLARSVFSFLETSITALRLFKLKELAARTGKYTTLFQALETNPQQVLITILIANCLTDVTSAALATHIMETIFAHLNLSGNLGFSLGIFVATMAILLFGEIIPKNIAKSRGDKLFSSTLWLANLSFRLLYPLVQLLMHFSNWFVQLLGGTQTTDTQWVSSEKEIQFLIDYINEKGLMETEKTEMLQNIFELGRTPVREIIIPANEIVSVSAESSLNDILDIFVQRQFTRIPVYQDSPDNVIGMIHLKDVFALLLSKQEKKPLKELLHPILFVPETLKVNQLLREFRQQHKHIAMVLNEHGIITGLITLEDVLEEIVGEISDEHESDHEKVVPLKNGSYLVDATISLEELQEHLDITIKSEESITLGGFLTEELQHVPKKGERVLYKNFCFQVQKATPKRVISVLIFKETDDEDLNS